MSVFYFDKDIQGRVPWSQVKQAQTADDSDTYRPGDIVEAWDHVFRWDSDCIPNTKEAKWRIRGDQLADSALPTIMGPGGEGQGTTDLLARLENAAKNTSSPKSLEVNALWRQLNSIDETPFQYDRAQIARGRAVFYRYAPHMLLSLLQFSLAAGFSSPRISRVLNLGSYLVPPISSTPEGEAPRITRASNDRTFMRLMETTQFVIDCMGKDAMEIGQAGWKAAIRVRLLHATMRRRILDKARSDSKNKGYAPYDENRDGVPISQEDYAGTLSAFGTAPLISLFKVGITPSPQECEDYTALWKVIGYYLGIDEDILEAHYSNWHQSTRMFASAIVNIFAGESDPPPPSHFPFELLVPKQDQVKENTPKSTNNDPYTSPATLPVLFSVVGRWPSPFTLLDHCAASRNFCGPSLSDWLSIPKTSWIEWFKLHMGYAVVNVPPKFAQIYRSGWDARRRKAMQDSVEAGVILELGDRVTKFRPRAPEAFEPPKDADEFGVTTSPLISGATMQWILVYGEMAIVLCLLSPLIPFYVAWTGWGIARQALAWSMESRG